MPGSLERFVAAKDKLSIQSIWVIIPSLPPTPVPVAEVIVVQPRRVVYYLDMDICISDLLSIPTS